MLKAISLNSGDAYPRAWNRANVIPPIQLIAAGRMSQAALWGNSSYPPRSDLYVQLTPKLNTVSRYFFLGAAFAFDAAVNSASQCALKLEEIAM